MRFSLDFFKKKETGTETYIGLLLKEDEGTVFFLQETKAGLEILEKEKFAFTNGWEHLTEDIDEILYKLETRTEKSPDKTIFFVYSHLIDTKHGEIKQPYLHKIKELVKNLELKPLGYIECHEALIEQLKKKEGVSLNAILIEIDKTALSVLVYKGGSQFFQETVARTTNIIDDLLPVFDKIILQTILPTRVILYDSSDLTAESGKLITYKWSADYFIQLPRIEIIKEEELIEGLLSTFTKQIFSKKLSKPISEKKEILGFVIGGDVSRETREQEKFQEEESVLPPQKLSKKPLGELFDSLRNNTEVFTQNILARAKALPRFSFVIIGACLIIASIFLTEYYFHTANVTIFLPSQSLNKNIQISTRTATSNSQAPNQLAIQKEEETVEFSQTKEVSGKRTIGEEAKGEVTVHNFSDSEKTVDKGTTIEAGGIKFTLNDSVKVASASLAPDGSAKLPGKAKQKITSAAIGPEGNLSKDQRFSVGDLPQSTYFAINESAFSGGTKKDIRTVSEKDIDDLEKALLNKAKNYKSAKLEAKLKEGFKPIKQLTESKVISSTTPAEVGEEAETVKLQSKIEIAYYIYKEKDLLEKLENLLAKDARPGFSVEEENILYTISKVQKKTRETTLTVEARAKASEKINKDELLKKITGRGGSKVEQKVKDEYKAEGLEFKVNHPLPILRNWFPIMRKNINLEFAFQ